MDLLQPRLEVLMLVGTGEHTKFIYHTKYPLIINKI